MDFLRSKLLVLEGLFNNPALCMRQPSFTMKEGFVKVCFLSPWMWWHAKLCMTFLFLQQMFLSLKSPQISSNLLKSPEISEGGSRIKVLV